MEKEDDRSKRGGSGSERNGGRVEKRRRDKAKTKSLLHESAEEEWWRASRLRLVETGLRLEMEEALIRDGGDGEADLRRSSPEKRNREEQRRIPVRVNRRRRWRSRSEIEASYRSCDRYTARYGVTGTGSPKCQYPCPILAGLVPVKAADATRNGWSVRGFIESCEDHISFVLHSNPEIQSST